LQWPGSPWMPSPISTSPGPNLASGGRVGGGRGAAELAHGGEVPEAVRPPPPRPAPASTHAEPSSLPGTRCNPRARLCSTALQGEARARPGANATAGAACMPAGPACLPPCLPAALPLPASHLSEGALPGSVHTVRPTPRVARLAATADAAAATWASDAPDAAAAPATCSGSAGRGGEGRALPRAQPAQHTACTHARMQCTRAHTHTHAHTHHGHGAPRQDGMREGTEPAQMRRNPVCACVCACNSLA
jgi:hypothetical protein